MRILRGALASLCAAALIAAQLGAAPAQAADPAPTNLLAAEMDTQFNGPTSPLTSASTTSGGAQQFVTVNGDSAIELSDSSLGAANPSYFYHRFTGPLMEAINDVYKEPVGSPSRQFVLSFDLRQAQASDKPVAKDIFTQITFGNWDNNLVPRFPVAPELSLTNTAAFKNTSGALTQVDDGDISQYKFTIVPNGGARLVTTVELGWEIRVDTPATIDEAIDIDNPSVVELPGGVVDQSPPTVPTGLTKGQVAATSASLSWSPSTDDVGVSGYNVYRDGFLATSTTAGTTQAVVTNLVPSTTYQITVAAKDASGKVSAQSAPLSMTTGPFVPPNPAPFPGTQQTRSQWLWDEAKAETEEDGPINVASYIAQAEDNQNAATNLTKLDKLYQVYDAEQYKMLSKMYAYLMIGDQYSPAMLAHVNSYFAQYSYKQLSQTENLRMSTYVTGYLLGQYLPDVVDTDGKSGAALMAEDKTNILAMVDQAVHSGWAEYESPEYTFMTYFGLNAIYQWATDPQLVQEVKMAMDVMWFEWANDWINGYTISSESRAKGDGVIVDDPSWRTSDNALLAWTYFGEDRQQLAEGDSDNPAPSAYRPDLEYIGLVAWSGTKYTPPPLAVQLGQKTDKSYTSFKTNLQNSGGNAMDIYRTSYVRPTWGLGTEVQYRRVDNWIEDMPMVLRWQSDAAASVFRVGVDQGNAQIGSYDDPNEQRVMQDNGAALAVFKSNGDETENYLSAMFPDTGAIVQKEDVDGWTLVNTGVSYFAFRMADPATWYHQTPSDPSNKVKTTTQIHPTTTLGWTYDILRSQADRNGWVLDTADASEYASLDAFAAAITSKTSLDTSHVGDASPRLVYHSLHGDTLDLTYDSPAQAPGATHLINGTPIDYDSFKLFDTPYLQQEQLGDTFTATVDGQSVVYNFSDWTVTTPTTGDGDGDGDNGGGDNGGGDNGGGITDDGATAAPAAGVLSSDNGWDTGLLDGSYNVTMNLWWGQNASQFKLFEDGNLVSTTPLAVKSPGAQRVSVPISGKADGSYVYTGELVNSKGTTEVGPLTVTVRDASPGAPTLSDDNWDHDGDFTVSADLWWGTNATQYRFLENGVQVGEGDLTAATPGAQHASLDVTGRPAGVYDYVVEFTNGLGQTVSQSLSVVVS
ncbi:hypothetical protein GCM10023322_36330 [Rugosimonospora acidiphila]|uniref:Fibronectin type-III domain-containing protein n=1 Tax=Rugosimonospora acidiphila TaxID=556531 RepID=A0ABP9RWX6_9ACTN